MLVHKVKTVEFIYKQAPKKVRNKRAAQCKIKATRFRTILDEELCMTRVFFPNYNPESGD